MGSAKYPNPPGAIAFGTPDSVRSYCQIIAKFLFIYRCTCSIDYCFHLPWRKIRPGRIDIHTYSNVWINSAISIKSNYAYSV